MESPILEVKATNTTEWLIMPEYHQWISSVVGESNVKRVIAASMNSRVVLDGIREKNPEKILKFKSAPSDLERAKVVFGYLDKCVVTKLGWPIGWNFTGAGFHRSYIMHLMTRKLGISASSVAICFGVCRQTVNNTRYWLEGQINISNSTSRSVKEWDQALENEINHLQNPFINEY